MKNSYLKSGLLALTVILLMAFTGKESQDLTIQVDLKGDHVVFELSENKEMTGHTVELQRSANGLNFSTILTFEYTTDLTLLDTVPNTGFNYYRVVESPVSDEPVVLSQVSLIYVPGNFDIQCVIKGESPDGKPYEYTFSLPENCAPDSTAILVPVYDIYGNQIDVPVQVDPKKEGNQLYINLENNLTPSIFTVRH